MKVFILIGLTREGIEMPYGFRLEAGQEPRKVGLGREDEFATWLSDRGIEASLDWDNWIDGGIYVDLPDRLVVEIINAWSGQR